MLLFLITVAFSLALNFLLVNGYKELLLEAEDLGSITAKTINDYPVALAAVSVIFPALSIGILVLFLFFLRRWVPYARTHSDDKK